MVSLQTASQDCGEISAASKNDKPLDRLQGDVLCTKASSGSTLSVLHECNIVISIFCALCPHKMIVLLETEYLNI
jgi:hypothetical protein